MSEQGTTPNGKKAGTGAESPTPGEPIRSMFWPVLACVAAGLLLRAWALWAREVVDFDEVYYYILGRNLVTGKGYVLNGLPHTAFPPLYPLLAGLTSLITSEMRLATSLITAVSGALLSVPVYFLGKDIYGRRAGIFAAAATAVWPALFFFAAKYVAYERRLYCGSETLYVTIFAAGALFFWRFARAGGWWRAILAGSFFGLASLVRSEGPVIFAFLFAWLLVDSAITGSLWSARRLFQTALVAVAMAVVFSPFLFHVRDVTGHWSLGAKLTNNVRIRDTLWNWARRHRAGDFVKMHYRLNDDNAQMVDPYWGVSDWHREAQEGSGGLSEGLKLVANPDWRWLPFFCEVFVKNPQPLMPWCALLFVLSGIAAPPWHTQRLRWWAFAVSSVVAMMFLAVTLYVLPRHELPLLTLASIELGNGVVVAMALLRRGLGGIPIPGRAAAGVIAGVPAAALLLAMAADGIRYNIAGNTQAGRDVALSQEHSDVSIAKWAKANLPAESTFMCHGPWIAVWAGMDWRVPPAAPPGRILAYAVNRRIEFATIRWSAEVKPEERMILAPYEIVKLDAGGEAVVYDLRRASQAGGTAGE